MAAGGAPHAIGGPVMTIATGEHRPIVQWWPDGSYTCPWCGAANDGLPVAGRRHCFNPACWASSYATVEYVRAAQERRARAERERQQRQHLADIAARMAAKRRAALDQLWAERRAEAEARGACLICLRRSYWETSPRYVKHRRADYHDN